ncbi:MAG: efflux RND transporter periplasmic adaptor subunit [Bdellovibrionota bacterium]
MRTQTSSRIPRIIAQVVITSLVMVAIIAGFGLAKYFQIAKAIAQNANFKMPPESVTADTAREETWAKTLSSVGSLSPFQGVTLAAEEAGKIERINFESGATVKQGDVLIELDTSVEEANLESAKAKEAWTRTSYERAKTLRPQNVISQDAFDNARSQYEQALGEVRSSAARIERRKTVAPFSGQTGIRLANVGQHVEAGTPLVPLQSLEQLYLNFSLPQQTVGSLAKGQQVTFTVDAFGNREFKGTINAIDPQIDERTRTIRLQAIVPNDNHELRPGMFARVNLLLGEEQKVIVIPATSINYAPYGDTVYVIEKMKDPKGEEYDGVRQQVVRLGDARGDLVAVTSGLKPGEQVVTSGLFKLRPGAAIAVNNDFKPGNSAAPKPSDS